jgi:CheY-like chemotaxis protein
MTQLANFVQSDDDTAEKTKKRKRFVIVIADDDVDDQELMRKGLQECKVAVHIVAVFNGIQLMDFLLKRHSFKWSQDEPDLIFLDLNMPLMDGFMVLKEIKSLSRLKSVPLYVITTSRSSIDKKKAIELGASGFYSKGSSSKDIIKIMREVCEECF